MDKIFSFSESVCQVLLDCGWSESRQVDICDPVSQLAVRGYCLHDAAELILKSFWGLRVVKNGSRAFNCTTTVQVGNIFTCNQVVKLSEKFAIGLYPIGTTSLSCLFCSPEGLIYAIDDDRHAWYQFVSIERMLDVLLEFQHGEGEENRMLLE